MRPWGLPLRGHGDSGLYTFCRWLAVPLFGGLYRCRLRGMENLPVRGPVIVITNHKSNIDPVIVGMLCDRPLRYMAKKELFRNPALSRLISHAGCVPGRPRVGRPGGPRDLARGPGGGRGAAHVPRGAPAERRRGPRVPAGSRHDRPAQRRSCRSPGDEGDAAHCCVGGGRDCLPCGPRSGRRSPSPACRGATARPTTRRRVACGRRSPSSMAGSEPSAGAGGAERPRCDDELDRGLRWLTRPDGVQIVVARNAGYCYGVERALGITAEALDHARKPVASLGPIIHNPSVVGELGRRGVEVVEEVGAAQGGTLIVRTHGVAPDVLAAAEARGIDVIDATCPFVAVAQRKASDLQDAGYTVVILGEHDHPEVAGLAGFAGPGAVVVEDAADLPCDQPARAGASASSFRRRRPATIWPRSPRPWLRSLASCSSTTPSATPPRSGRAPPASWPPGSTLWSSWADATAPTRRGWRSSVARSSSVPTTSSRRPNCAPSGSRGRVASASRPAPRRRTPRSRRRCRSSGGSVTARGLGRTVEPVPLPIEDVREAAARAGLRAGDCIARLNGVAPIDVLDLEMAAADGTFSVAVLRDGHPLDLVVAPRRGRVARDLAGTRRDRRRRPPCVATAVASASSTRCRGACERRSTSRTTTTGCRSCTGTS